MDANWNNKWDTSLFYWCWYYRQTSECSYIADSMDQINVQCPIMLNLNINHGKSDQLHWLLVAASMIFDAKPLCVYFINTQLNDHPRITIKYLWHGKLCCMHNIALGVWSWVQYMHSALPHAALASRPTSLVLYYAYSTPSCAITITHGYIIS